MIRLICDTPRPTPGFGGPGEHQRRGCRSGVDIHCERPGQCSGSCATSEAGVHFLVGGTQATPRHRRRLRPTGCCAPRRPHPVHETGAVEATGHKVWPAAKTASITAQQIDQYCSGPFDNDAWRHGAARHVYLSLPHELGTVYTLAELEEISRRPAVEAAPLCDGARPACGLAASDVTLPTWPAVRRVLPGGHQAGLLFGEAVVITNPA